MTNKDKDLLTDMLRVYTEYLNNKIDNVGDFLFLAHETGDIASSGQKYTENRKFWDVRDNIRKYLEDIKKQANRLIIQINNPS